MVQTVGTHRATAVVCNLVQALEAAGAELTTLLDETGSEGSRAGSWAGRLEQGDPGSGSDMDTASGGEDEWEARRPRAPSDDDDLGGRM